MLRGPPGKPLGCSQPYAAMRVLDFPPCFQAGLVQRVQHLGVFTVHCFVTHSTGTHTLLSQGKMRSQIDFGGCHLQTLSSWIHWKYLHRM